MKQIVYPTILFVLFSFGCRNNPESVTVTVDPLLDSTAKVEVGRVIDGDTVVVGFGRDSFSVRILGIDAFEIKHDARLDSQAVKAHISVDSAYALGQAGKKFADSLLAKQNVLLVRDYDQPVFDTYNRLLRHVFYYQGSQTNDYGMLLIQKGLALVDTL
ncbi:MAG: thermonuclease family protein [Bacteroidota bacterium]|nr:thermonuclease family protein [Bacteroidota bacterium]